MAEQEGVIKFQLDFFSANPLPINELREIGAWRKMLYLTQLIGQTPDRYDGYGFGNISCRLLPRDAPLGQRSFVISGTQTGNVIDLQPQHYAVVRAYDPASNLIVGEGPIRPSSESLTHGMIYDMDTHIQWVMHAHSPHIWHCANALDIPMTDAQVAYGTPAMADEVVRLFTETDLSKRRIFGMEGHEDGIISFGGSAEEAGSVMLLALAAAFRLSDR